MLNKSLSYKSLIIKWCKDMYPFNRSLTGKGVDKTLGYLKSINKNLKILKFPTGKKVFDWEIPKVWNVTSAYIQDLKTKKKYCDIKKNNLHLVGYSQKVKEVLSKNILLKKIYTHPKNKDWIPYKTSYYKQDWGFCCSRKEKSLIKNKKYYVVINSKFSNGHLKIGEYFKKGKSKKEILFSTYICHPSMANNEISGPCVQSALIDYVKNKKTKFSYRFVFLPETIGSIAYLSLKRKGLKKNFLAGFNLSCVGDNRMYSIIKSKSENSLSNQALISSTLSEKKRKIYDYIFAASDERQYNSPGIDLDVAGFCRTKYKSYPEYHSSADNFKVVTPEGLFGSFTVLKRIIDTFELELFPKTKILCEPFLSKRNLYPTLSGSLLSDNILNRKNIIKYCDGKTNTFQISIKLNLDLELVLNNLTVLKTNNLI